MPPFSTRIEEEGVQINNVKLVAQGVLQEAEMLALLRGEQFFDGPPREKLTPAGGSAVREATSVGAIFIHIQPAIVSIALWRPTSSTNSSISGSLVVASNSAQACTDPADL